MGKTARRKLRLLDDEKFEQNVYELKDARAPKVNLTLNHIEPLTENQNKTFDAYKKDKSILLHGLAGTGKTFISMYLSLKEILSRRSTYKKLVIVRSAVPTRDIGFLPGNQKEKAKAYESPYYAICTELFNRGDAYDILKNKGTVEFTTTSFLRGCTINDAIVIVDEMNNMTFHELDSVITRIGSNSKIILCGDFRQSDLTKESDRRGLRDFMRILSTMGCFEYVEFSQDDIVRSGIVKDYIIAKDELGMAA